MEHRSSSYPQSVRSSGIVQYRYLGRRQAFQCSELVVVREEVAVRRGTSWYVFYFSFRFRPDERSIIGNCTMMNGVQDAAYCLGVGGEETRDA